AVRPPHDLDVIWVTTNLRIWDDPESFMQQLAADLGEQYREFGEAVPKISVQTHSITLEFDDIENGYSIDVVPATPCTTPPLQNEYGQALYKVPEVIKKSHRQRRAFYNRHSDPQEIKWVYTDPKGYIKRATELDAESKGSFRKAAKLFKA